VDEAGERAGPTARETEIASVCRAVSDLLRAQECMLESLSASGMLDARATGVLAAIDQLTAEACEAEQRLASTWDTARAGHDLHR